MGKLAKFEEIDIDLLNPYQNNSREHDAENVEEIANSIKEFGFIVPILVDMNYNIIAGHGRLLASLKLGLKKVPCVFAEGLSAKQKKAYIIADNRLAEKSKWNQETLYAELTDLYENDFDTSLTGFDIGDFLGGDDDDEEPQENERLRTDHAYNLDILDDDFEGFFEMPVIRNDGYIPSDLMGFNYAKSSDNKQTGIHFYIDDYQFERIWNDPKEYVDILAEYECILSPDFSLYMDMPMAMKIWNVFRSRAIGHYYQQQGLRVIPTISWGEKATFKFAFDGIPNGSIVSVSTIGVKQSKEAMQIWRDGMDAMIKKIQPSHIVVYGGEVDYDYGDIQVTYFQNKVTEAMKRKRGEDGES